MDFCPINKATHTQLAISKFFATVVFKEIGNFSHFNNVAINTKLFHYSCWFYAKFVEFDDFGFYISR